jgi:hypothetical protein
MDKKSTGWNVKPAKWAWWNLEAKSKCSTCEIQTMIQGRNNQSVKSQANAIEACPQPHIGMAVGIAPLLLGIHRFFFNGILSINPFCQHVTLKSRTMCMQMHLETRLLRGSSLVPIHLV